MLSCVALIEFDKEVYCSEDVLGKNIFTIINKIPIVVVIPRANSVNDHTGFDELIAPEGFSYFKSEWGKVYRRPDILAGVKMVGAVLSISQESVRGLFAAVPAWKNKIESIFSLKMQDLTVEPKINPLDKTLDGGINIHTGLHLFALHDTKISELHNPNSTEYIELCMISESNCLNYMQFKNAFDLAASDKPISPSYTHLSAAYDSYKKGDFRSAVICGGTAVENCILQKLIRHSKENGIELKRPVGELGRKFNKLKEYGIIIPVKNYKTEILEIRNDAVHKGSIPSRKTALEYLKKCRVLLDHYEPSIVGIDEE